MEHKEGMAPEENPLVSICCLVYNHGEYLKEALDGFLMQKTTFPFEVVIHDDASTDNSASIIKEYALKHPKIFKPLYQTENQKSKLKSGMNPRFNFPRARGKYIAFCEGDDYWTDPLKLQKQVDFLERHPDYGVCFHNVLEVSCLGARREVVVPNVSNHHHYSIQDYILNNKTATCSVLIKKELFKLPNWFSSLPFGDLGIVLIVLKESKSQKGFVFKDTMGVYRVHEGGVHGSLKKNNSSLIKAYKQHISFIRIISKKLLFEKKYKKFIYKKYSDTYKTLMDLSRKEHDKFNYIKFKILSRFYGYKCNSFK